MNTHISEEFWQELEIRLERSTCASMDEFIRLSLAALDNDQELERKLLEGLNSEEIEMTEEEWAKLRREGLKQFPPGLVSLE